MTRRRRLRGLIRLARAPGCATWSACVPRPSWAPPAPSPGPPLPREIRERLAAPVPPAAAAAGPSGDFVADIPLEPDHPSRATLDGRRCRAGRAGRRPGTAAVGRRDPVFAERYLATCCAGCHTPTCSAIRGRPTWSPRTCRRRPTRSGAGWAVWRAGRERRPRHPDGRLAVGGPAGPGGDGAGGDRAAPGRTAGGQLRRAGAPGPRVWPPDCRRTASAPGTGSRCWYPRDRPDRRGVRLLAGGGGDRGRGRRVSGWAGWRHALRSAAPTTSSGSAGRWPRRSACGRVRGRAVGSRPRRLLGAYARP